MKEVNPSNLGFKGPILLTGFFESVLQQHFLTPDGIFDDALKELLWKRDNEHEGTTETRLYINYSINPKKDQSNFRPAILVARGDWSRKKIGMYDNFGTGDKIYGDKIDEWVGSHTFTCLAKSFVTAELLGHEVATFFEVYGYILANQICLKELSLTGISAPSLVPEDNETYAVTVGVDYRHHNRWSLASSRPKIRHIRPLITVQDYDGKYEPKTTLIDIDYNG